MFLNRNSGAIVQVFRQNLKIPLNLKKLMFRNLLLFLFPIFSPEICVSLDSLHLCHNLICVEKLYNIGNNLSKGTFEIKEVEQWFKECKGSSK